MVWCGERCRAVVVSGGVDPGGDCGAVDVFGEST